MPMFDFEREEIKKSGKFLEDYGYSKNENQYSINYCLNNISISIVYPPNSEESEINIRFIDKNEVFSVGWIAFVRGNIKWCDKKLVNIKKLLNYIKENYFKIIDYQFCTESDKLVDKYVKEHYTEFKNSVLDFLKDQ